MESKINEIIARYDEFSDIRDLANSLKMAGLNLANAILIESDEIRAEIILKSMSQIHEMAEFLDLIINEKNNTH